MSKKTDNKPTYLLRLSSDHAHALLKAVNLFQRLSMGDFHEIGAEFEGKNDDWKTQREKGLDEVLDQLKGILAPDLSPRGHNYGYGTEKTGKNGHLAYEILKCLQHRVSWTERPLQPGEFGYHSHDAPILFPSGITPPECIAEDGKQPELERSGAGLARELEELLGTRNILEAVKRVRELVELESSVKKGV